MPLAAASRDILPMYINAQVKRWESAGASEGPAWDPLKREYASRKLVKFADYPEQGRRMLVGTGDLLKAVTLQGGEISKGAYLPEAGTFRVVITSPFAEYVDQKRTFSKFGLDMITAIKSKLKEAYFG